MSTASVMAGVVLICLAVVVFTPAGVVSKCQQLSNGTWCHYQLGWGYVTTDNAVSP